MHNLSEKSLSFCNKILEAYPVQSQTKTADNSSKNDTRPEQPYSHLHDHRKQREIYEKSTEEKLQNMRYFKNIGNQKFKQDQLDEALYFYQKTILYSDYTFPDVDIDLHEMQLLVAQANMNTAISFIKQNLWKKTEMYLREATKNAIKQYGQLHNSKIEQADKQQRKKIQKLNSAKLCTLKKSYFWFCKYHMHFSDYDDARKYVNKLEELNQYISSKEQSQQLKKEIESSEKQHQRQEQHLSKKMFSN